MSGQLPVVGGHLPVVVGLGPVDPALVTRVLDGHCRFVPDPGEAELSATPRGMGLSRRATAATFTAAAQGVLDVLAGRGPGPSPTQPGSTTVPRRPSHDQLR